MDNELLDSLEGKIDMAIVQAQARNAEIVQLKAALEAAQEERAALLAQNNELADQCAGLEAVCSRAEQEISRNWAVCGVIGAAGGALGFLGASVISHLAGCL